MGEVLDHIIYIATTPSGKKYVGKTHLHKKGFSQRKNQHYRSAELKNSPYPFHRAIRKYGRNAIIWEIYGRYRTEQSAFHNEIKLIKKLGTKNPTYGYNCTDGGEGASGKEHSQAAKKKMGLRNKHCKQVIRSDGVIFYSLCDAARSVIAAPQTISKAITKCYFCRGFSWEYYTGGNVDNYFKSNFSVYKRKTKKIIRSDGLVFESVKQAASFVNLLPSTLSTRLDSGMASGGYMWFTYTEGLSLNTQNSIVKNKRYTIVVDSSGKIYPTIASATREHGVHHSAIVQAIKKGHRSAGLYWRYYG